VRALLLVLLLAACHAPTAPTEPIALTPAATFARTITQGHPYRFQFDLPAGRFLDLSVEQRSLDVVVSLRDPAGRLLLEVDNPDGRRKPETVLAVTPAAGAYTLEVRPFTAGAAGDFVLIVRDVRPASPEDQRRAAMAATLARAERQWHAGDFEGAAASLRAALPGLERNGERRGMAHAQWRLGTALSRIGALRESARVLEQAAAGFRGLGDGAGEARAQNDLGATWRLLGEPGRALGAYQRALDLYRRAGVLNGEASAVNNIGLVRQSTGELQAAIAQYEEALELWRRFGDKAAEAATLQNLGNVYLLIGHDEEAMDLLRKALALSQGEGHERVRRDALIALGWAEYLTGHPESALERYGQALALAQRLGDRLAEAGVLDRQASALKALGRLEEAEASFTRALTISRAAGSRGNEAHTLASLAALHLEADPANIERARNELRQSLDLMVAIGDLNGEAGVRFALSRLERRRGAWRPARQQIETAIQRLEELRAGLRGPASRGSFLSTRYTAYEEMVALLMDLDRIEPEKGHAREALEVAEKARARNLLDLISPSLGGRVGDGRGGQGVRSGGEALALQAEVRAMDERRRVLEAQNPRDPRLPGLAAALRKRALELDRHANLAPPEGASARSPGFQPGVGSNALTARQIQNLADSQTLLVVYLLAEPASFAWTVDRERIVVHVLPGRQTIETLARRVAAALPRSHEQAVQRAAERALRDLAGAILTPLGERLAGRPRLVLLPDGALNLIPFAALPVSPEGAPLLVDHEIVLLPSATVLVQQRRRLAGRPPAPEELAILAHPIFSPADPRLARNRGAVHGGEDRGDPALGLGPLEPLPFTEDEANAIARLVPADRRLVVLGAAASRDLALSGVLSRYRILHFATHGLLHPVLAERSGLVLSTVDEQGRPRDGFLSAPDVASLDLPADLVVLSACRTGLGREIRGEGLVGLTQAFFRAGARAVVVSSWDVRDRATADLMARFYTHLLVDREPPATALRHAQLALRADPKTAAPTFWAGFSLHGDWQ